MERARLLPRAFLFIALCSLTSRKGYSADGPHAGASGVHLPKVTWDKSEPVSISFRATTYSFKIAGVKIPGKLSSKCYKAVYSILADKLENNNLYDGKSVGGSAMGGSDLWTPETVIHVVTDSLC